VRTTEDEIEEATDATTDVFGVSSASPAVSVEPEIEDIVEKLAETAREVYAERDEAGSFAVRARRAGEHDFSSEEIGERGGSAVYEVIEGAGYEPEVDLDNPDIEFFVECRETEAFVFLEKREGAGGMPLGSQEKVVALISGGIDSPVAAWEVMKRECPIVPVYIDLGEYGGADQEARMFETVRRLAEYAPGYEDKMKVRRVPAGDTIEYLVESTRNTRMLSYRRFMLKCAEHIALKEGAVGIVTGEALGQKSSQTSANLATLDDVTTLPVHRPLLTMDKQDIIARAKEIGTFEDSTLPAGCNRIAPDNPRTASTVEKVEKYEPAENVVMEAIE
ncbi:MAG: THUMP domain-containing protein, partial [Halobacteria archaeon]|nr:THUMP domain-containing protein [Halobacteria archaeon]